MISDKYKEQFLNPEVRCDTYIGIEMKQVWFAELQMLEKFIEICKNYHLVYQMVGGSLLGAIRHKGFIPLKSLIDIAKSGNCPELLATVKKYNYASKRVMEKCSGELVRETDERWYYRLG